MIPGYKEIAGLVSPHALAEHVALFQAEVEARSNPKGTRADSDAVAGAALHDLYFAGLTPQTHVALEAGPLRAAIEQRWNTLDGWWQNEMRPAAMRATGWAVLATQGADLRVFVLDGHADGGVFGWTPIVAVDVYEHAYWMDFGTRKGVYLDAVYQHLNWPAANAAYAIGGKR